MKNIADYDADTYYANTLAADASDLAALRTAMNADITDGYRTYAEVRQAFIETDQDPENSDNVILFFTGRSAPDSDYPSVWNREHGWPKSWLPERVSICLH